jgi:protein gp37
MWAEVKACQSLTFQVLTKRPQNFAKYLPADWGEHGYPNVWLGVTVDDCKHGYPRVDILRETPAAIEFLSCEPLLEDISDVNLSGIDWVITGGESGHGSRPFDLTWARSLRDRCAAEKIAFFF